MAGALLLHALGRKAGQPPTRVGGIVVAFGKMPWVVLEKFLNKYKQENANRYCSIFGVSDSAKLEFSRSSV